jgi:CAAX protease family protein
VGFFWALASALLSFWASGWDWSFFGLENPKWKTSIIRAIFWAIAIFLFVDVLAQPFIENFFGLVDLSGFDGLKGNIEGYLIYVLIVWIVAAIGEEVAFRGYIQRRMALLLGDSKQTWLLATISSSIFFGLAHLYQGYGGVISTGLIGLILALIFMKNKQNLILCMFIHGFYDMIGLTLLYLDMERILVDPVAKFLFGN